MNEKQIKSISKFLSYTLRHHPQSIGLTLNEEGWANVDELLQKSATQFNDISRDILDLVVTTNDKKRFTYNEDGTMLRASQGHSIEVALNLQAQIPPEILYHGTVEKFIPAIKEEGLKKMNRQHVHLSAEKATAINVGSRRGVPIVLTILSKQMNENGYSFYLSDNGVWLTEEVPTAFIGF
jgi:putative RNA 2'-phosphotransferase